MKRVNVYQYFINPGFFLFGQGKGAVRKLDLKSSPRHPSRHAPGRPLVARLERKKEPDANLGPKRGRCPDSKVTIQGPMGPKTGRRRQRGAPI